MFGPIFGALVVIPLLLQAASSVPVQEKGYLYLGPGNVLELPSLTVVPCQQDCSFGPGTHSYISGTAAVFIWWC